jgi:peroxiredoxin
LPSLENLHQDYKGKPFNVVLISVKESAASVKKLIQGKGYSLKVLLDKKGTVSSQYNILSHPAKFLIDKKGNLIAWALGYREWDSKEMKQVVNLLISKE